MAAAGTDEGHHVEFAAQAERQRRAIVEALNADMTKHAKGKDFDYLADPVLWKTIPSFRYEPPALDRAAVAGDVAVLGVWFVAGIAFLAWTTRRAAVIP